MREIDALDGRLVRCRQALDEIDASLTPDPLKGATHVAGKCPDEVKLAVDLIMLLENRDPG